MAIEASAGNTGIGLFGALGVAFVVLKLCGVIGWSWWWITAPFWAPAAFALFLYGVGIALILSSEAGLK